MSRTTSSHRPRTRSRKRAAPQWLARARQFLPLRSWRLQLVGAIVALVYAILSTQSFASAREAAATYLIQPGDTLWSIAQATGSSLPRLIDLNGIANPDLILAGQVLQLAPGSTDQLAAAVPGQHYTVKAGDTLWQVSLNTGVPVDTLVTLNGLQDVDQLTIGQQLRLPTGSALPPQAPKPAAPKPNKLQDKVIAEARRVGGADVRVGVAAHNLVTGEAVNVRANEAFPSASVMKLPILVELERRATNGNIPWTDTLRAQAGLMISLSDNSAANQLLDVVGQSNVNDTMAKLGLTGTRLANRFSDARGSSNPGQNQTTPADMAHLLELIATDQLISPQGSADIRSFLSRSGDRSKLVRLLPTDARVAHKSGWYDGVANDVGIVSVDRAAARWVVAVFTDGVADAETGNQLIAAVSRTVYDAWAAGDK